MSTLSKLSFGLSSRLLLLLLVLTSTVSCSSGALGILTGGGPNVAANTQVGKTNTQTIGTTNNVEQRLEVGVAERINQANDNNKVKADAVQTVVVNEVPVWVILLLLLGWLLPSPNEMGRWIRSPFSRRSYKT
jgi:hypothetical protein